MNDRSDLADIGYCSISKGTNLFKDRPFEIQEHGILSELRVKDES